MWENKLRKPSKICRRPRRRFEFLSLAPFVVWYTIGASVLFLFTSTLSPTKKCLGTIWHLFKSLYHASQYNSDICVPVRRSVLGGVEPLSPLEHVVDSYASHVIVRGIPPVTLYAVSKIGPITKNPMRLGWHFFVVFWFLGWVSLYRGGHFPAFGTEFAMYNHIIMTE